MTTSTQTRQLLATVDVRELNTLRWGPLRQMFPAFVEEMELGRYLKSTLAAAACRTVEIRPHSTSTHVYDVYIIGDAPEK